jgi:hypothetical protein
MTTSTRAGRGARRPDPVERVAVTMTGELVDLFPDRATGVARLVERLRGYLPLVPLRFWAGRGGFLGAGAAMMRPLELASANWLATATLVAREVGDGLFSTSAAPRPTWSRSPAGRCAPGAGATASAWRSRSSSTPGWFARPSWRSPATRRTWAIASRS